jgi:hypothetical protein
MEEAGEVIADVVGENKLEYSESVPERDIELEEGLGSGARRSNSSASMNSTYEPIIGYGTGGHGEGLLHRTRGEFVSSKATCSSSSAKNQFVDGEHSSDGTIGDNNAEPCMGIGEKRPRRGLVFQHASWLPSGSKDSRVMGASCPGARKLEVSVNCTGSNAGQCGLRKFQWW